MTATSSWQPRRLSSGFYSLSLPTGCKRDSSLQRYHGRRPSQKEKPPKQLLCNHSKKIHWGKNGIYDFRHSLPTKKQPPENNLPPTINGLCSSTECRTEVHLQVIAQLQFHSKHQGQLPDSTAKLSSRSSLSCPSLQHDRAVPIWAAESHPSAPIPSFQPFYAWQHRGPQPAKLSSHTL